MNHWSLSLFGLLLASSLAAADVPDSREADIAAQQHEKSRKLKPQELSRGEQTYQRITKDDLIGRILSATSGLGLRLGGLPTGSGFALGPRYHRPDLADEQLVFDAYAVGSISQYYRLGVGLGMPRLARGRFTFDMNAFRGDSPSIEYYGPGPRSSKNGRTNYRLEENDFAVRAGWRPTRRHLMVGVESGVTLLNAGPGQRAGVASTEQVYGPALAPGIDRQTNFFRAGPIVRIDFTDLPFDPHKGTRFEAKYLFYRGLDLEEFGFQKVKGTLEQYIPFWNEKRVIALRAMTEFSLTDRKHVVPFYMQAVLGGSDDLRGYRRFRFYDDNSAVLSAEYRWEVMPALDMAVFGDAGQVFSKRNHFAWNEMRGAMGFGFRIKNRNAVIMRLDTGFSREGFQIWFKFGHAY